MTPEQPAPPTGCSQPDTTVEPVPQPGQASGAWVRTAWSGGLSGRRSRDTAPEILLRQAVHHNGLRFRLHRTVLPRCTPDFVLPRHRLAVFVDGCFWHGCPEHGPRQFNGPNRERWAAKMEQNRTRDRTNNGRLDEAGWTVLRFWECAVRQDAERCAGIVRENTR